MQTLQVGKGYVNVQKHFRGAAILPKRGMVGTEVVELAAGQPAPPDVVLGEHGGYYYFGNPLTPVSNPAHVQHLPEPHRTRALTQIADQAKKPLAPIKPAKDAAAVRARAQKTAKPVKRRAIKTERDLVRETGGVTLEHAMAQGG